MLFPSPVFLLDMLTCHAEKTIHNNFMCTIEPVIGFGFRDASDLSDRLYFKHENRKAGGLDRLPAPCGDL